MRLQTIYEQIWDQKVQQAVAAPAKGDRASVALALLPPGQRLLDVGCGDGSFLVYARDRYEVVQGVDISQEALRRARQRKLAVVHSDINESPLPFPSRTFDTAVSLDVIEHVLDPRRFLREMSRVLKPGGWLIISTPNIRYVKHLFRLVVRGRFPRTSGDSIAFDGGHLHYFTAGDVTDLVRESGCEPVRTVGIVPSRKLSLLRPIAHIGPVYQWLAAGLVIKARRTGDPRD